MSSTSTTQQSHSKGMLVLRAMWKTLCFLYLVLVFLAKAIWLIWQGFLYVVSFLSDLAGDGDSHLRGQRRR